TTTAYVLYALAAILGGFLLNTMRVRQLEQRAHKLEKGIEERTIALQQRTDTITKLLADKDQLFANISHEFRTPLTLILGPLDASLKVIQDDKLHSLMTLARTNAQRLLAMVDQLLDISRLQDFKPQEARPKNVLDVCQFLLDSYHSLADEKHIVLNMDNRLTTAVYVDMLPDALEKILSNLLTNAFKYSDGEQVINLKLSADQQWVKVDVSDTGLGISEENQHNIFDRFTRVENTLEYIPGAGIGLALVRELIEQHGGTISVESEPGVGSTFSVVLPLAANQAVDESDSKVPVVVNKGLVLSSVEQIKHDQLPDESPILITDDEIIAVIDTDRPSLLVIEDNYDMRHYITSCLVDTFDVTVAVDGEQGVEKARELLPDLVISDVMMPKMDGFEVTKALKTDLMTNHIPIILLTAHGDRESRLKGWGEKVDEYLEKPFNTTELLMRIDNLLAIRGLLRQRYQREFAESSTAQGALPAPDKALAEEQQVEEPVNQVHQAFLNKINQVLAAKYTDEKFNLAMFADEMALSSRQLSRKMKALLDMSPVESIRSYRLKKAAELLSSGVSPSVVAHEVGFTSHSYFSQCFKAQYQCMPSSFTGKPISEEEEA
ncbi:MAG: signal transduction histidine kinase/DNA-binding response OmpR family regulator, partial [Phenylobacterium sp.]